MTTIKSYIKRNAQLDSDFTSFKQIYQELSDYHLAHRGRFLTSDRNKGHKRNTKQINNTSRLAVRVCASGMMSGITSPARPWFMLQTGDNELDNKSAVKEWCYIVQNIMYDVFAASNLYNSLHVVYQDLIVFGTPCMGVYEDFENVIFCKTYPPGSYKLATNGKDEVDTFYREYDITIGQCVKEFGYDNCSLSVQNNWNNGNTENSVTILQVIEPNDDRDNVSPLAKDKRYRSVYFEKSSQNQNSNNDLFLLRSGFDDFPILAPRWEVTGEDVYATDCPGMIALGDAKALQLGERRLYQALDKVVSPPLQGASSLKNQLPNGAVGPNDIIWTDEASAGLKSIYDFRPDLNAMMAINKETEGRIKRAFYEDLFLMLANTDRRDITAREVAEKHEEKLLMLGPVLERLHNELLNPLIDRTFNILQKNGVFPLPPEELRNKELSIKYISVLAQAQRMVATTGVERVAQFVAGISPIWSEARHKINASQLVDDYSEALGVNPAIIRSDDQAAALSQAEQANAQMQQAAMMADQMANTAKTASEANTENNGVLAKAMNNAQVARR